MNRPHIYIHTHNNESSGYLFLKTTLWYINKNLFEEKQFTHIALQKKKKNQNTEDECNSKRKSTTTKKRDKTR
jgi:hypothetical protein